MHAFWCAAGAANGDELLQGRQESGFAMDAFSAGNLARTHTHRQQEEAALRSASLQACCRYSAAATAATACGPGEHFAPPAPTTQGWHGKAGQGHDEINHVGVCVCIMDTSARLCTRRRAPTGVPLGACGPSFRDNSGPHPRCPNPAPTLPPSQAPLPHDGAPRKRKITAVPFQSIPIASATMPDACICLSTANACAGPSRC